MSRIIRRFLARHRRNGAVRWTAQRARSLLFGFDNFDYDPEHNGERFLIDSVARAGAEPLTFFDVGANRGDWSLLAARVAPTAKIHAFELIPDTAHELGIRVGEYPSILVNEFGLSDSDRQATAKMAISNDTRSTLIIDADIDSSETREILCPVRMGDTYVKEQNIARIDLLKIDVEGAENLVLKGFSETLAEGKIDAIQFEYGWTNIVTRFLLSDFYDLLTPYGFVIGKLYPNYVDFTPYTTTQENFLGPNYVAVHENRSSLIDALRGSKNA